MLSEKYEEAPDQSEYSLQEEIDQHDVLHNPESLAPFLDVRKYNENNSSAILLQQRPSNSVHNSTISGLYMILAVIVI